MSGTKSSSDFDLPGKARRVLEQPAIGGGVFGGIDVTRNLIALHTRYNLPMQSLAQFETAANRKWFRSKKA